MKTKDIRNGEFYFRVGANPPTARVVKAILIGGKPPANGRFNAVYPGLDGDLVSIRISAGEVEEAKGFHLAAAAVLVAKSARKIGTAEKDVANIFTFFGVEEKPRGI